VKSGKHTDEELKETAEKLIYEYLSIVAGSQAESELSKKNEMINLDAKIKCMAGCENFIVRNKWEDVCGILNNFGYKYSPDERDKIKQRILSIKSTCQFNLDRIKLSTSTKDTKPIDADYFVRECVMVETHFKMQIDFNKTTAKKYGYYVKKMCDEIKSMQIASQKKR